MKYPLTFYTDFGVGKTARGSTRMCFIFIRPKHKDDEGLYQHELTHVKQWAATTMLAAVLMTAAYSLAVAFFPSVFSAPLIAIYLQIILLSFSVFSLLYGTVPYIRLLAEVQAFKKQLNYYSDDRTAKFAGAIAKYYNLKITPEEVERMLVK
tara:strand:- start:100 stop:555 length:456 start_codon:yes stop_codon:yes gene_type:complete